MCQGHLSVYLVFGRVGSREGQLKKHLNMWDKICSSNYAQESRRGYGGTWYKQTNFLTFRNVFHYRFFEGEKFWDENAMMQFVLNLYMRDLVLPEDQKKKAQSLRKLLRLVSFLMDVCFLIFFFLVNNSSWWYSLLIFFLVSQPTKLGAFGKYLVFFLIWRVQMYKVWVVACDCGTVFGWGIVLPKNEAQELKVKFTLSTKFRLHNIST